MNTSDIVRTIAERGFTERQARFLVLIAQHSGVCVMRQYSRFAGIVFGQKTRKFFARLERLGWVSTYDCAHNRARIYHLRHRDLYAAIGEPDSRLRRPPAVPRALERLMVLDAILENPDITWLSTPEAKITHVSALARVPLERMPHARVRANGSDALRYFPDRLPVGIHPEGRWVFVCLLTSPKGLELLAFLHRHAPLLFGLPAWTVRVAVPPHVAACAQHRVDDAGAAIAMPLRDPTLAELRWYFEQLRPGSNMARSVEDEERFRRCARAFAAPRWSLVYRSWREDGETALEIVASDAIGNALASGAGRIELLALPHAYSHLAPLVGVA